jgi:hypothetical protein
MTPHEIWVAGGNVLVVTPNHHAMLLALDQWELDAAFTSQLSSTPWLASPAGGKAWFATRDLRPDQLYGVTLNACEGIDLLPPYARAAVEASLSKLYFPSGAVNMTSWSSSFAEPEPTRELELTFGTEPLVGWRAWRIVELERRDGTTEPRLASLTGREFWTPRRRLTAQCLPRDRGVYAFSAGRRPFHEAPWPGCDCGVWALRDQAAIESFIRHDGQDARAVCFGPVYLWGRVLEFSKGLRGQHCYPKQLHLLRGDTELAARLVELYGVPVEIVPQDAHRDAPPPQHGVDPVTMAWAFGGQIRAMGQAMAPAFAKLQEINALLLEAAGEPQRKPKPPRPRPTLKDALRGPSPQP